MAGASVKFKGPPGGVDPKTDLRAQVEKIRAIRKRMVDRASRREYLGRLFDELDAARDELEAMVASVVTEENE